MTILYFILSSFYLYLIIWVDALRMNTLAPGVHFAAGLLLFVISLIDLMVNDSVRLLKKEATFFRTLILALFAFESREISIFYIPDDIDLLIFRLVYLIIVGVVVLFLTGHPRKEIRSAQIMTFIFLLVAFHPTNYWFHIAFSKTSEVPAIVIEERKEHVYHSINNYYATVLLDGEEVELAINGPVKNFYDSDEVILKKYHSIFGVDLIELVEEKNR